MRFSITRILRERRLRREFEPLKNTLQGELSSFLQQPCQLTPARGKGGYDRLYYVEKANRRFAIMRIKNCREISASSGGTSALRRALNADERLECEWRSYEVLSAHQLAPEPIWRSDDATVSAYYPYPRVAEVLKKNHQKIWVLLPLILGLVREMHALGVVHMDLNLGNMLVDPKLNQVMVIDFEYSPASTISFEQACRCDYYRVVDDLLRPRRGGKEIIRNRKKFIGILQREAPAIKAVGCRSILSNFPNIMRDAEVYRALASDEP